MKLQHRMLTLLVIVTVQVVKNSGQEICGEMLCINITAQPMTWIQAENYCHGMGADLATRQNIPNDIFIRTSVNTFWIRNGDDDHMTRQWRWLTAEAMTWPLSDDINENPVTYRDCLTMHHTQAGGQSFLSSDCEMQKSFICETEHGRECRLTASGINYKGTTSVTDQGNICDFWREKDPSLVPDTFVFTDGNKSLANNHCRNPDSFNNLWCYITNAERTHESCNQIQPCLQEANECFGLREFPKEAVYCNGQKCFIAVYNTSKTWMEATECCKSMEAKLAIFDTDELGKNVYDRLQSYISRRREFWLGGYDRSWDSIAADGVTVQCYVLQQNGDIQLTPCASQQGFACEYESTLLATTTQHMDSNDTIPEAGAKKSEGKDDNKTLIYIGIGVGIGVLLLIIVIVSIACACRPKKKKERPFSPYKHQIYSDPLTSSQPTNQYYGNSVFEENDIYDTSGPSSQYYDIPNGNPVSNGGHTPYAKANNKTGMVNPMYGDDKQSMYSQPNKKYKKKSGNAQVDERESMYSQPSKKAKKPVSPKPVEAQHANNDYAELPDLPPRPYSEQQSEASFNF